MTSEERLRRVIETNHLALSDQQKLALEIAMDAHADGAVGDFDTALQQALRQWKMYAEMEERDLRTEASPEGEMYREAFVLTSKLTMKAADEVDAEHQKELREAVRHGPGSS